MQLDEVKQQSIRGGISRIQGKLGIITIKIITLMVLSRLLDKYDFGVAELSAIIIGFIQIFVFIGFGEALVQRKNIDERHVRVAFTCMFSVAIALILLLQLSAHSLAVFFESPELESVIRITSFFPLLASISNIAVSLILRELEHQKLAKYDFLSFLVGYLPVTLVLAWIYQSYWAIVFGNLVQIGIFALLTYFHKPYSLRFSLDKAALDDIWKFSAWSFVSQVFNYFGGKGDNFIIGKLLGINSLGVYSRSFSTMNIPVNLIGHLSANVTFTAMSRLQDEKVQSVALFYRGLRVLNLLLVPFFISMIFAAPDIIDVLLGPQWIEAIVPFQILIGFALFRVNTKNMAAFIMSAGYARTITFTNFIFAGLVLSFVYLGAEYYGLIGATLGIGAAYLFLNFLLSYLMRKKFVELPGRDVLNFYGYLLLLIVFSIAFLWFGNYLISGIKSSPIVRLLVFYFYCSILLILLMRNSEYVKSFFTEVILIKKIFGQVIEGSPPSLRKLMSKLLKLT